MAPTRKFKQAILRLPSGRYIKKMVPGERNVPRIWEKTETHAELYIKILYLDFLAASSKYFVIFSS